jgi:hypothetical protein
VPVGICARNSIISLLQGDLGRSVGVVTAIRQSWLAARPRLSRSDPVLRLVRLRQRFVRRCQRRRRSYRKEGASAGGGWGACQLKCVDGRPGLDCQDTDCDYFPSRLLRTCGERPSSRAAEQRYERAPLYCLPEHAGSHPIGFQFRPSSFAKTRTSPVAIRALPDLCLGIVSGRLGD